MKTGFVVLFFISQSFFKSSIIDDLKMTGVHIIPSTLPIP